MTNAKVFDAKPRKKRPIDHTKKSNIKCEHCKYGKRNLFVTYGYLICTKHHEKKKYWNRCKSFEWPEYENTQPAR